MNAKTAKEKRALGNLERLDWAKPLLATVEGQSGSEGFLFELRFAHEIARASVTAKYEHKTSVGNSTVDFCLSSDRATWNVELVTVETSAAVTNATVRESIFPGIEVESMMLGRGASRDDGVPLTTKQAPESELLRLMSKLEGKIADSKRRPIKFPPPKSGVYNMLLVDMRRFEGIGYPDRDHCRQIVYGPGLVRHKENVMSHPDGAPILGLWNAANPRPAAQIARERVHVFGFVHEEDFVDDEIREVTFLMGNPALDCDVSTYPLRWATSGDSPTPLRRTNSLWNDGPGGS